MAAQLTMLLIVLLSVLGAINEHNNKQLKYGLLFITFMAVVAYGISRFNM